MTTSTSTYRFLPWARRGLADRIAEIDTGAPAARIVGITADRVAVLVSAPEPAVVVYDETGAETSRTPVDIAADAIVTADRLTADGGTSPTPAVRDGGSRYSLIGNQLLAVSSQSIEVPAPPSTPASSSIADATPPTPGLLAPTTTASAVSAPPETVEVKDLTVLWTKNDARGLPAVVGDQLLMPVDGGLAVFTAANGNPGFVPAAIPVDRGGYPGRVDATAFGDMVIETRSDQVVCLTAS